MFEGEKLDRIAQAINMRSTINHFLLAGLRGAGKDGPTVEAMLKLIDLGCYQQINNIVKEYEKEGE